MSVVEGWKQISIGGYVDLINGFAFPSEGFTEGDGMPLIRIRDLARQMTEVNFRGRYDNRFLVKRDDLLIGMDGDFLTVKWKGSDALLNQRVCKLVTKNPESLVQDFLFYRIIEEVFHIHRITAATTVKHLSSKDVLGIEIGLPPYPEQAKIAEILSTVDRAIEQTEALIAKQQRIKTGLMQDLLTRGIDEHGNLRSEKTHKFKDSPLGRIPVEWEVDEFGRTVESAVDGPFGSNLKSDHYVSEPGVRVIRLGNIGSGQFLDSDKAWVSSVHGRYLSRHSVRPEDLLVASLGDENHPFGRACLYTDHVHEAIVKADVFRIRCKPDRLIHLFTVQLFNFPLWRRELFALAQGVTRDRVNLTNLMLLRLPIPPLVEQKAIACMINSTNELLNRLDQQLLKHLSLKTALMQDLLTGDKSVNVLLEDGEDPRL